MGKSLLEILRQVAVDPAEQAALAETGAGPYLARHGFPDVEVDDVREAVSLVADTLPPEVAQALAPVQSELAPPAERAGPPQVAAFGDAADDLDRVPPDPAGDAEGTTGFGTGAAEPEASLTFGAGADLGPLARDGVADHPADPVAHGADEHGDGDGDAADSTDHWIPEDHATASGSSLDPDGDLDGITGADVDAAASTGDIDEGGSHELPEDPAALDDIGSF